LGWLNDRPVLWTVAITIVIVGGMYFAAVRRLKPSQLQAPEGEVFVAGERAAVAGGGNLALS
jgi:hypothetical protein